LNFRISIFDIRIRLPALGAAALIGMALLIGLALTAPRLILEVLREGESAPLVSVGAGTGVQFSLQFLHSYDRAFFQEHYRLEASGGIILSHMRFKSCLNGQGFEMGTYRPLPDGSAELADINRAMGEITFRLGSADLADHTLVVGERRLRLLDYAEAGDLLCIRSAIKPRWRLLGSNV
jgi:hypothetical protein